MGYNVKQRQRLQVQSKPEDLDFSVSRGTGETESTGRGRSGDNRDQNGVGASTGDTDGSSGRTGRGVKTLGTGTRNENNDFRPRGVPSSESGSNPRSNLSIGSIGNSAGIAAIAATAASTPRFYSRPPPRAIESPRSNAPISSMIDYSDYFVLQSSKRDLYLTGAHGLTSLYPEILLTTPRTSRVIDVNSGLTTTPFVIDLNNEIKKSVESTVRNAINQYSSVLQLTTTQYDQNVQIANQYADLCIQGATAKDNLVKLFNVINITTQNVPPNQNIVINGQNYQFLSGKPTLFDFLKDIDSSGAIRIDDWIIGTNTKNVAQILKFLTEQFVIGKTETVSIYEGDASTIINGRNDRSIISAINQLKEINPLTASVTRTDAAVDNLTSDVNTSQIDMSTYKDNTADLIADMIRLAQRDLLMQSVREQASSQVGVRVRNIEDALAQITGKYKDFAGNITPFNESIDNGITDINSFIESPGIYDVTNVLVATQDNQKFGKLDGGSGVDYLLYDGLARASSVSDLQELTSFANDYTSFSFKLQSFNQLVYRDDQVRKTVVKQIRDMILTFINGSRIDTEEISSNGSTVRIGCLMAAAVDDTISKKLFSLMCALDKLNNYGQNAELVSAAKGNLLKDEDGVDRGVFRPPSGRGNDVYYRGNGQIPIISFAAETGDVSIESSYFEGTGISFLNFHNIARELEKSITGDLYTQNEASQTLTFAEKATFGTDFSLNLSRDARAFIFYQHFLHILRQFYYEVQVEDYVDYEISFSWRPAQFKLLKFIAENYDLDDVTLSNRAYTFVAEESVGTEPNFGDYVVNFRNKYFTAPIQKINNQEQNCFDLVNVISNHAAQINQASTQLKSSINAIYNLSLNNQIANRTSLINDIQTEQAFLKKNLVDRFSYPLRGATYLPSAIDHNVAQAVNTKTVVSTLQILNDSINDAITRKFLVAVGIPTGLMEILRYQNTRSTSEHLYSIDLVFKNLQISQAYEDNVDVAERAKIKSYTFSTRIFLKEGYQLADGPDVKSSQLTNYEQIYAASKYKIIDDNGIYRDSSASELELILGGRAIIDNHLLSHYSKLLLKTTAGITLDEEVFDLVPQTRRYPDAEQDPNYTTVVDQISFNYPNTAEGQLNKERVLRDLSRSIQLAPEQHKISMMSSKTFERIHVIPIDIDEIIEALQITSSDVAFLDVVAKIRLEDNQPPVLTTPTRRSYTRAATDAAEAFKQVDISTQSANKVGLNTMIETSKKFSGIMGGRR